MSATYTQPSLLDQPITGSVEVSTERLVALADRLFKAGNRMMAEALMQRVPGDRTPTITMSRALAVRYGLVDA